MLCKTSVLNKGKNSNNWFLASQGSKCAGAASGPPIRQGAPYLCASTVRTRTVPWPAARERASVWIEPVASPLCSMHHVHAEGSREPTCPQVPLLCCPRQQRPRQRPALDGHRVHAGPGRAVLHGAQHWPADARVCACARVSEHGHTARRHGLPRCCGAPAAPLPRHTRPPPCPLAPPACATHTHKPTRATHMHRSATSVCGTALNACASRPVLQPALPWLPLDVAALPASWCSSGGGAPVAACGGRQAGGRRVRGHHHQQQQHHQRGAPPAHPQPPPPPPPPLHKCTPLPPHHTSSLDVRSRMVACCSATTHSVLASCDLAAWSSDACERSAAPPCT